MSAFFQQINQTAVAVGTSSLAAVGNPIQATGGRVCFQVKNVGANPLTHFGIYRQFVPGGDWLPWMVDADFLTATSKSSASGGTSGNVPQTIPAGQSGWVDLDVGPINAIQVYAQAGAATTLEFHGYATQDTRISPS